MSHSLYRQLIDNTFRIMHHDHLYVYLPQGFGIAPERRRDTFRIVFDPKNTVSVSIFDLRGNFVCDATEAQSQVGQTFLSVRIASTDPNPTLQPARRSDSAGGGGDNERSSTWNPS